MKPVLTITLKELSDGLLSLLQITALVLLLFLIITLVRWLFRKAKGAVIFSFDIVPGDQEKGKDRFDGKSIADSLLAELCQILRVHQDEQNSKFREEVILQTGPLSSDGAKKLLKSENINKEKISEPKPASVRPEANFLGVTGSALKKSQGDDLFKHIGDAQVNVGGMNISIGRLLITFKQLWNDRDPEISISGSLQKFGKLARLIARLDRQGYSPLLCEVSNTIDDDSELPNLIRDLAFKIFQELQENWTDALATSAKTWVGFKHYTGALDGYHQYKLTGRTEDLERARDHCHAGTQAERDYIKLVRTCYEVAGVYYDQDDLTTAKALYQCSIKAGGLLEQNIDQDEKVLRRYGLSKEELAEMKVYYRETYIALSITLYLRGDIPEVKATMYKAKELGLLDSLEHDSVGDLCAMLGLKNEAIQEYKLAIESSPENANLYHELGNLTTDIGQYDEAIIAYQNAIALNPEEPIFYNDLGLTLLSMDLYEKSMAEFNYSIALNPDFAHPYNNRGLIFQKQRHTQKAIADYEHAIKLDPTLAEAYINLGNLYKQQKKLDKAALVFEQGVARNLQSDNIYFHLSLGEIYYEQERNDESIYEFNRALDLDPENAFAHDWLGYLYIKQKRLEEAIVEIKRSIELDPNNRRVQASLAACYRKLNCPADYERQLDICRQLKVQPIENDYQQACFEALCGETDKAIKLLEEAINKKQQSPEYANRDTDFDFIRDDPRFQALVSNP